MTDKEPLFSVIVAVFNGKDYLQACIDSFWDQAYKNKQLIIIDGGSTDGTVDIIRSNNSKIDYWISEPDRGIYHAWNKGLEQATGDWICFLGADDYFWQHNVLEDLASQLQKLPENIRVAYGKIALVTKRGSLLYMLGEPWLVSGKNFDQGMTIPHPGTMHHKSIFEQHGGFDESFRIAGDYELLLRELKSGEASFVPLVIAGMRLGGISSDPGNSLMQLKEVRRAQRKHGYRLPGLLWLFSVGRIYVRLVLGKIIGEKKTRQVLDWTRSLAGKPAHWTRDND